MRTPEAVAGMLCPVCKVPLAMSDRQGIEIDYCPSCRGVWLDRGELDKIVERSAEATPAAPPPQQPQGGPWQGQGGGYRDDDYRRGGHDPRYHHKKKRSFFEDLFD